MTGAGWIASVDKPPLPGKQDPRQIAPSPLDKPPATEPNTPTCPPGCCPSSPASRPPERPRPKGPTSSSSALMISSPCSAATETPPRKRLTSTRSPRLLRLTGSREGGDGHARRPGGTGAPHPLQSRSNPNRHAARRARGDGILRLGKGEKPTITPPRPRARWRRRSRGSAWRSRRH
jgi:hypothetical protein